MEEIIFFNIYKLLEEELKTLKISKNKKRKAKGYYNIRKHGKLERGEQTFTLIDPEGYVLINSTNVKKLEIYAMFLNYELSNTDKLTLIESNKLKYNLSNLITNNYNY